jgi:hypothetical protein
LMISLILFSCVCHQKIIISHAWGGGPVLCLIIIMCFFV